MTGLEYAIAMESDGEKYYREQAKLNQRSSVGVACLILAKAEHKHALLLRSKLNNLEYVLPDEKSYMQIKNVFSEIGDLKSDIRSTPSQLDFYRTALELEQNSINLYTSLLSSASDAAEKDLLLYLIGQEELHFSLLDSMVTMLRHAEEWVESAEFGLRNETY